MRRRFPVHRLAVAACSALLYLVPLGRLAAQGSSSPRQVTIVARDYAFVEAPDTLPAGLTTFILDNRGTVKHELVIFGLAPGQPGSELLRGETSEDRRNLSASPIGVLFAPPGAHSPAQLTAELLPGRFYVITCNFRDTKEMPFHFNLGMVDSIYVK